MPRGQNTKERSKNESKSTSGRGGQRSSGGYTQERRSEAAKKGWETRRKNTR